MQPLIHKGQIVTWKSDRGFGFIKPENGGREIFLHITAFKELKQLPKVGDVIFYQLAQEKNGRVRAIDAVMEGDKLPTRSKPNSPPSKVVSTSSTVRDTLLLLIVPGLGAIKVLLTTGSFIPFVLYLGMSGVTFLLYQDDKTRAQKGRWRIQEKTLHICELLGGWPGAFVAQRKLRHKSSKASYQVMFWAIVGLHLIGWVAWLLMGQTLIDPLQTLINNL